MELTTTMTTQSWHLFFFPTHNFSSYAQYFIQPLFAFFSTNKEHTKNGPITHQNDERLCRADLNMVMDKLGIPCDQNPYGEFFGAQEVSALFEEEPSLAEVREAFDVFDENRDGFIDAMELRRVLCRLGLEKASRVEECKRMISVFDENGDGVIDFSEFLKFMERCLC